MNSPPNQSQAFERSGGIAKRVWLCRVEPKAGRPNAWDTHESTEPSMNCAERMQHHTQRDDVRSACPESFRGSASRAYSPVGPRTFTRFTLVGPACLSSGR